MASPRSSVETVTPYSHNSPPTSPSTSASNSSERIQLNGQPQSSKGKQRATDGIHTDPFVSDEEYPTDFLTYPPANDDDAETHRVEENLRRWEVTERQRRKQARESQQSTRNSLLGDISHRASLLWPGKRTQSQTHRSSLGTHVALQSQENVSAVSVQGINASPTPSPSHSPSPLPGSENPSNGTHEMDITTSPFADPQLQASLSSDTLTIPPSFSRSQGSQLRKPPPPRPLNLPSPRTPPATIDGQPTPTPSPTPSPPLERASDSPKEVRWWHDWLCGCSEGPNRGGDYQSGRTNPME